MIGTSNIAGEANPHIKKGSTQENSEEGLDGGTPSGHSKISQSKHQSGTTGPTVGLGGKKRRTKARNNDSQPGATLGVALGFEDDAKSHMNADENKSMAKSGMGISKRHRKKRVDNDKIIAGANNDDDMSEQSNTKKGQKAPGGNAG
jgi:hypothetical protein